MPASATPGRLADAVNHCQQAAALETAATAAISEFQDDEVRQWGQATTESVRRLEARIKLLHEAHRIAEVHRAGAKVDAVGWRLPPRSSPSRLDWRRPRPAWLSSRLGPSYFFAGS